MTRRLSRAIVWLLTGTGVVLVSGAGLGLAAGPARADASPGADLSSYSLDATAPGVEWTYDSPTAPTHPELDAEVPETMAQLQPGPIGFGLATVAWPGTLIANGGSTAGLLGLSLPQPVAAEANEPIRAQAETGSGPPTVTNDSYPGATMTASATDTQVSGDAAVSGTSGPAPSSSVGPTESTSDVAITGPDTVETTASSTVKDIDLAGVVKIASVTSTVTGISNGRAARASGSTVVSGATIAGQPVSIDQSGVHVLSQSAPLNAVASEIVNTAVASLGMKVAMSQPTESVQAGNVTYTSGSLVFFWSPPGSGGQTFTATLGGASIDLQAVQGMSGSPAAAPAGPTRSAPAAAPGPSSTAVPAAAAGGGGESNLGSGGATLSSASSGSGAAPAAFSDVASQAPLPSGLSPWWIIGILLGSVVIAGGLRRLPDRVLEDSATVCSLEDQP